MRPVLRVLVVLSAATAGALGPAALASAAGSGSVTTAPSAEGWYQTPPSCALPTGCPAPSPSPYPADTLHIGVLLGTEEARTTLQLDLSKLPGGTKPAGGQLRVPVSTSPQDGSRAPETAKIRACVVTEPVKDADGSVEAPPEADCEAASVDAVYVPATAEAPAAFTVDLSALATAWAESTNPGALALVPGEVAPTDSWHVAVSDRTREGEGVAKITASVSFVSAAVDVVSPPPFVPAPVDAGFSGPAFPASEPAPFAVSAPAFDAPLAVAAAPVPQPAAAVPAPQAPVAQVVPVASVLDGSFRYPAVFLLPLLFALGAGWLGRALTRDLAEPTP